MVPEREGFPGHHLFGDSVCMGSVKQKGRRVARPPYLYGLRFHSLYWKRPLGGSGVSLAFFCYMDIALGGTGI